MVVRYRIYEHEKEDWLIDDEARRKAAELYLKNATKSAYSEDNIKKLKAFGWSDERIKEWQRQEIEEAKKFAEEIRQGKHDANVRWMLEHGRISGKKVRRKVTERVPITPITHKAQAMAQAITHEAIHHYGEENLKKLQETQKWHVHRTGAIFVSPEEYRKIVNAKQNLKQPLPAPKPYHTTIAKPQPVIAPKPKQNEEKSFNYLRYVLIGLGALIILKVFRRW